MGAWKWWLNLDFDLRNEEAVSIFWVHDVYGMGWARQCHEKRNDGEVPKGFSNIEGGCVAKCSPKALNPCSKIHFITLRSQAINSQEATPVLSSPSNSAWCNPQTQVFPYFIHPHFLSSTIQPISSPNREAAKTRSLPFPLKKISTIERMQKWRM